MLPVSYEPTKYRFRIDDRDGIKRLLLTSTDLEEQSRTQPMAPLWWREMGDERTLKAAVEWVRLRRVHWQEWGDMARNEGRAAITEHLYRLFEEEPPCEAIGVLIEVGDDACQLSIGDLVRTRNGTGKRIYYTHTFASEPLRKAFHQWLLHDNPEGNGRAMLEVALNSGTGALAKQLDQIASEELEKAQLAS